MEGLLLAVDIPALDFSHMGIKINSLVEMPMFMRHQTTDVKDIRIDTGKTINIDRRLVENRQHGTRIRAGRR